MKKKFVIDTSVLIHDPKCLFQYEDNEIYITGYTLVELDKLKSSKKGDVAYSARETIRHIQSFSKIGNLKEGVIIPDTKTTFRIGGGSIVDDAEKFKNFDYYDIHIIEYAKEMGAILVSKDVNMRLIAQSEDVEAQDYTSDKIDIKYGSKRDSILESDTYMTDHPYRSDSVIKPEDLGIEKKVYENDYVKIKNDRGGEFALKCKNGTLNPISDRPDFPKPRNIEQEMAIDALLDPDIKLVSLLGKAGTGKTYIALGCAIHRLDRGECDKILLTKPVVPVGRDLGYLPGEMSDKLAPWAMSYYDNLDQIIGKSQEDDIFSYGGKGGASNEKLWEQYFHQGSIEIQPLHTIRGRSIPNVIILVDEVQNMTPHEVKTLVTRAAEGTKVVLMGDPTQIDNSFLDEVSNGLTYSAVRMRPSKYTASIEFVHGERSVLAEEAAKYL